ncbi:MAG TPA: trehalase family glycosidase [bacterium]|nr:trehalase family glycosidase [bacterium]
MTTDADLITAAQDVLRTNDLGGYTKPSPRLYPHQWNWDSAFAAIGWAHVDWARAVREVDSLLAGQWINGMLPAIRYNPDTADYFPGPEWWPNVPVRRSGEITNGIAQPLVLPTAVYLAGLLQPVEGVRHEWWARIFDPLRDALLYFPRHRTVGGSPLVAIIHPWESGLDNSPRWDFAVRKGYRPSRPYRRRDTTVVHAAERPVDADYDFYMYLVEQIAASGYEGGARLAEAPFAVYDALFNAIWYLAAVDLNRIAHAVGKAAALSETDLHAFHDAYHATLWNEGAGLFRDYDVTGQAQIPVDTVAGLGAIWGGLVDAGQAASILAQYQSRSAGCRMVPSTPPTEPAFDPARYWRGPAWVNTNWFLARGLEALGLRTEARGLADATLDLVRSAGIYEYYHAYTGAGLGGSEFTWTAALGLDLLRRPIT